jgi:outer membrane protein assembly factor BamB
MTRHLRSALLLVCFAASTAPVFAADATPSGPHWAQWRGPARDGSAPSFEAPAIWPEKLRLVWQAEVGHSDAGPVAAGNRVFTFTRIDERETITALDLEDGSVLWQTGYDAPFRFMKIVGMHGAGPYSTPLVAGDAIFTYGISEILSAHDTTTGRQLWQRSFDSEFKVAKPFYGNSLSPMLVDGKLILEVGGGGKGALLAVDPKTGEDIWRLEGDGPAYGSPIVADFGDSRQIVTLTQKRLIGADLATGRLLWEQPFVVNVDVTSTTPLVHGSSVQLAGQKKPLRSYRIEKKGKRWSAEETWRNEGIWMDYSSPVMAAGSMVGFSVKNKGQLVVVDPASGETTWESEGRQGENSFLIASGDLVLSTLVDGDLEVLRIADGAAQVLATYPVAQSAIWSHPALVDRYLLVKDQSHLRVWELSTP